MTRTLTPALETSTPAEALDVGKIYAENAEFVWRALFRLGVRRPDLEDTTHEVFMVVHRRLDSFDGSSRMTTWLFGICMRVAAAYRRKAFRRLEDLPGDMPEPKSDEPSASPEDAASLSQARQDLDWILERMDLDRRAAFVMYEIDAMPCEQIAVLAGVPVGTIHSRLHTARREFASLLEKLRARRGRTP